MSSQFSKAAIAAVVGALCATAGFAQAPPGPARGPGGFGGPGGPGGPGAAPAAGGVAVANPTYFTMLFESEVINRPAAEVWKRIGKYCDIGEWMRVPCQITSGKDGELGAVRSIGREILVGKTELSYSYTQPVVDGRPYNLYHGTMEVRPLTATTSKVVYSLMWDNSMLDDAGKEREKNLYKSLFDPAIANMKILAEGGTLPPAPPRGGFGGGGAPRGPGGPPGGAPRGPGAPGAPGAGAGQY